MNSSPTATAAQDSDQLKCQIAGKLQRALALRQRRRPVPYRAAALGLLAIGLCLMLLYSQVPAALNAAQTAMRGLERVIGPRPGVALSALTALWALSLAVWPVVAQVMARGLCIVAMAFGAASTAALLNVLGGALLYAGLLAVVEVVLIPLLAPIALWTLYRKLQRARKALGVVNPNPAPLLRQAAAVPAEFSAVMHLCNTNDVVLRPATVQQQVLAQQAPAQDQTQAPQYEVLYAAVPAKLTFAQVQGMAQVKQELLAAGVKARDSAENGIMLYGKPGNGKTMMAEALAGQLGVPIISLSIADLQSKWVGQTTEQLVRAFRDARAQAPCVLFFDEVDSIIRDRNSWMSMNSEAGNTTNAFLAEVVKARGTGVVIVAATNYIEQLDTAAIRDGRFDFKVEITPPDQLARIGLVAAALRAEGVSIDAALLEKMARRWEGFSVARVNAIGRAAGRLAVQRGVRQAELQDLTAGVRQIQATRSTLPEGGLTLDQLSMDGEHRKRLEAIAWRMQHALTAEEMGASVPDGLLFAGPPGAGKTQAVAALARRTGWSLLTATGADLAAEPAKIEALIEQAKDLRPAIVFIDEADDLLGDRAASIYRASTNRLLALMDGVGGRTPDLLFIAATNVPEALDAAVLRGGRFGEHVHFELPQVQSLTQMIEGWLAQKGWQIEGGAQAAAQALQGMAFADVRQVLQTIVNNCVTEAMAAGQPLDRRISAARLARRQ